MKTFITILFAVLMCSASIRSHAQTQTGPDTREAAGFVKQFFNIYKTQGHQKAFDYISTKNSLEIFSADQWNVLRNKMDTLNNVLGPFIGAELITEKHVAASLVLFSYLVKYKNHPMRYIFTFYKPEDHWVIYNVKMDSDDLLEELRQSANISFLNAEK